MKKFKSLFLVFPFLTNLVFAAEITADNYAFSKFEARKMTLIGNGKANSDDFENLDKENLRIQSEFMNAIEENNDNACIKAQEEFDALITKWDNLLSGQNAH